MSNTNKETNTKDWHIYKGSNNLSARDSIKPPWREVPEASQENKVDDHKYYYTSSPELLDAVNAAIYLRRPLLITGEPGIGKTTLAKSIAKELTKKPMLKWHVTSKSELKDGLYAYDALARLYDIQIEQHHAACGQNPRDIEMKDYLTLGPLGEAFVDSDTRVVLIDEIDKSDMNLPNDLLHIFEEQKFFMPEVKRTKKDLNLSIDGIKEDVVIPEDGWLLCQKDFPIVIMTSNGEREFSPAFLRRCIRVDMKIDKNHQKEEYQNIIKSHFKDEFKNHQDNIEKLIELFIAQKETNKKALLSNDQLLNAAFLVIKKDVALDKELFKENILKSLRNT